MTKMQFTKRNLVISISIALVLILVLTLSVVAQIETDDGEPGTTPELVTAVEEIELDNNLTATTKFMFISANTFVPYDDDMTYNYHGGGCVYRTGGTYWSDFSVQLPAGAEIDYIRLYFYDNDAVNNASVFLFSFDGTGTSEQIQSVTSSGTPGQSSVGSGYFSYIVDNTAEALSLRLSYSAAGNSLIRICGVRIRYQYSNVFGTFLPLIKK